MKTLKKYLLAVLSFEKMVVDAYVLSFCSLFKVLDLSPFLISYLSNVHHLQPFFNLYFYFVLFNLNWVTINKTKSNSVKKSDANYSYLIK